MAAGVVLVIALTSAAGLMVLGRHDARTRAPEVRITADGTVPSAYSQAPSTHVFNPIGERAADPKPLTSGEVFGDKTISDKQVKASLRLTASKLTSCGNAVWGRRLAEQFRRLGCTQAARAMYTDKHFAALVTIFNLKDATAADRLVVAVDPRSGSGFPLPLEGGASFGQGFSTARGLAMGHYATITWVRRTDGSGGETDTGLLSLLVTIGPPPAILSRVADHAQNG